MDVQQAVSSAREYILAIFSDELSDKPTLEEVWFDDNEREWCVTFGLKRSAAKAFGSLVLPFDYKVVRLSDTDGKPISIRDRSAIRDR